MARWRDISTAPKDGTVILTDEGSALWDERWYLAKTSGHVPSCGDWGREVSEIEPSVWRPFPDAGGA